MVEKRRPTESVVAFRVRISLQRAFPELRGFLAHLQEELEAAVLEEERQSSPQNQDSPQPTAADEDIGLLHDPRR